MRKTFKYRLYPTKKQAKLLEAQLEECRWLYNHFLAERKDGYEKTKQAPGLYKQQAALPKLKQERPTLAFVHSQVLQNVAVRVDLAFQAFFRRCRAGEKPGYPRFKGRGWYDSFTYPQYGNGCEILKSQRIRLSKVGDVKFVEHRKFQGKPKTCTIKRSSTGKWYVSFSCEVFQPKPLKPNKRQVGIDVGLSTFATLSNGEEIKRQRWFKQEEDNLAKAQRKLSKETKGTPERTKRKKTVARIHERTAFRRHNFAHQTARQLVNNYGFIAVENLQINRMVHDKCFAKSIMDVTWGLFFALLFSKAESAGRTVVKVNPAYTSQTCSSCGHRQPMPVTVRVFDCPCCHASIDRDHNAALNILRLGLQSVG